MKKILFSLFIFFAGFYTLTLYSGNKLIFYINDRYINLSFIASIILMTIGILSFVFSFIKLIQKNNLKKFIVDVKEFLFDRKTILIGLLLALSFVVNLLFIVLIIALFIPFKDNKFDKFINANLYLIIFMGAFVLFALLLEPKALSPLVAAQRADGYNTLNITDERSMLDQFEKTTTQFSIKDWIVSFSINPENSYYKGKKVDLTGFAYTEENSRDDEFLVSRFVIRCCSADATPIGLDVKYNLKENGINPLRDWVRVQGEFDVIVEDGKERLIIIPERVEKSEQPDNPYLY